MLPTSPAYTQENGILHWFGEKTLKVPPRGCKIAHRPVLRTSTRSHRDKTGAAAHAYVSAPRVRTTNGGNVIPAGGSIGRPGCDWHRRSGCGWRRGWPRWSPVGGAGAWTPPSAPRSRLSRASPTSSPSAAPEPLIGSGAHTWGVRGDRRASTAGRREGVALELLDRTVGLHAVCDLWVQPADTSDRTTAEPGVCDLSVQSGRSSPSARPRCPSAVAPAPPALPARPPGIPTCPH